MTLRVAVDFGTSSTCVAVSVNGREPQVVALDGRPVLSSAVYASSDGRLFVGLEAEGYPIQFRNLKIKPLGGP